MQQLRVEIDPDLMEISHPIPIPPGYHEHWLRRYELFSYLLMYVRSDILASIWGGCPYCDPSLFRSIGIVHRSGRGESKNVERYEVYFDELDIPDELCKEMPHDQNQTQLQR
jgi:hypothetical protein